MADGAQGNPWHFVENIHVELLQHQQQHQQQNLLQIQIINGPGSQQSII